MKGDGKLQTFKYAQADAEDEFAEGYGDNEELGEKLRMKVAAKAAATRPKPIGKRIAIIKAKPTKGQTNIANKYISFEGDRI